MFELYHIRVLSVCYSECLATWTASMTVWRLLGSVGAAVVGAWYTVSRAQDPSRVLSLSVMASRCWRSRSLSCWFSRLRFPLCFFRASRCSRAVLMRCITCCNSGNSGRSYRRRHTGEHGKMHIFPIPIFHYQLVLTACPDLSRHWYLGFIWLQRLNKALMSPRGSWLK